MYRLLLFTIAAIVFAVACKDVAKAPVIVKSTPTPAVGHVEDAAPRISLADAKKDFDEGTAVFIDTHSPEDYAQRHIKGSINVPANNLAPYVDQIPKGKKLIAYCS